MKSQSVLLIQTSLLKTVLTLKTPEDAIKLLNKGIRWHQDLEPIIVYIKEIIFLGKESFNFELHLQAEEKWATDLETAYVYQSQQEFNEATEMVVVSSQEEELKEKLTTIASSPKPIEKYLQTQVELAQVAKNPLETYGLNELAGQLLDYRQIIQKAQNGLLGATTGIEALDRASFGFQGGHFWVMGGTTSGGKTWLALQMMMAAVNSGKAKALYVTMELSAKDIMGRIVANQGHFSHIRCMTSPEAEKEVKETIDKITQKNNVFVNDNLPSCNQLEPLVSIINEYATLYGVNFFVIDYFQNIVSADSSEYEMMNKVCLTLQSLCRLKNICVLGITQFNRESVKTKKKDKNALFQSKGSGNIENSADFFLQIESSENSDKDLILKMVKNRPYGIKTDALMMEDREHACYNEFKDVIAINEFNKPISENEADKLFAIS